MNTTTLAPQYGEITLQVPTDGPTLTGTLVVPKHSQNLIVFVLTNGKHCLSSQNRALANILHQQGFATLLLDLDPMSDQAINNSENYTQHHVSALTTQLAQVTDYLLNNSHTGHLKINYLGLQDSEKVAILVASEQPEKVSSVILLSHNIGSLLDVLPNIKTPTLLLFTEETSPDAIRHQEVLAELVLDANLMTCCDLGLLFYLSENLEFIGRYIGNWLN